MGILALWDAMNIWDVVKGFGRGIRWLFVGVKRRERDVSYLHLDKDNHPLGPMGRRSLTTTSRRQKNGSESSIEVVEQQREGVMMGMGMGGMGGGMRGNGRGDLEAPALTHQHQYAHGVYGHEDTSYRGASSNSNTHGAAGVGRSESFDSLDLAGGGMPRSEYERQQQQRGRSGSAASLGDDQHHYYEGRGGGLGRGGGTTTYHGVVDHGGMRPSVYRNQSSSGYYDPLPAPREDEDSVGLVSHAPYPYGSGSGRNGHR